MVIVKDNSATYQPRENRCQNCSRNYTAGYRLGILFWEYGGNVVRSGSDCDANSEFTFSARYSERDEREHVGGGLRLLGSGTACCFD
jgi:hypothetical protein